MADSDGDRSFVCRYALLCMTDAFWVLFFNGISRPLVVWAVSFLKLVPLGAFTLVSWNEGAYPTVALPSLSPDGKYILVALLTRWVFMLRATCARKLRYGAAGPAGVDVHVSTPAFLDAECFGSGVVETTDVDWMGVGIFLAPAAFVTSYYFSEIPSAYNQIADWTSTRVIIALACIAGAMIFSPPARSLVVLRREVKAWTVVRMVEALGAVYFGALMSTMNELHSVIQSGSLAATILLLCAYALATRSPFTSSRALHELPSGAPLEVVSGPGIVPPEASGPPAPVPDPVLPSPPRLPPLNAGAGGSALVAGEAAALASEPLDRSVVDPAADPGARPPFTGSMSPIEVPINTPGVPMGPPPPPLGTVGENSLVGRQEGGDREIARAPSGSGRRSRNLGGIGRTEDEEAGEVFDFAEVSRASKRA